MSSSKTIDERRQQREKMQERVNNMEVDLKARLKRIADFESHLLLLENGEKGSLFRLAKSMKTTEDMETLKVVSLLNRHVQLLMFSSNSRRNWLKMLEHC